MKTTVRRAYVGSVRVLVGSWGQVFDGREWVSPTAPVIPVGRDYESWSDVPFSWANGCPYWR